MSAVDPSQYVVESLASGWTCRNPTCGMFNGDAKVFLTKCRACESDRPKKETMKQIYIAGSSAEIEEVARYARDLERSGWTIAHHWWEAFTLAGHVSGHDRDLPNDVRRADAESCLTAVLSSQVVWLLAPSTPSVGSWVELGAAISHRKTTFVSGDWRRTLFSNLATRVFDTHVEALDALKETP